MKAEAGKPAPTPEEIAEGLSAAQARQLLDAADIAPQVSGGVMHWHRVGSADSALIRKGLVHQVVSDAPHRMLKPTDLGRAVADVLAKRGAR